MNAVTSGSVKLKVELGVVEVDVDTGKYLRAEAKTTTNIHRAKFEPVERDGLTKEFFEIFHRKRVVDQKINKQIIRKTYKNILVKRTYERV